MKMGSFGNQSGAAAVEFALVAVMFFTVLFGIVEIGRAMYVFNTVQEVTRRAAREAVVSWVSLASSIQHDAIFRSGISGSATLPGASEISDASVSISYLNRNLDEIPAASLPASPDDNVEACLDKQSNCIAFVQAELCRQGSEGCLPIPYMPMVGLFSFFGVDIPQSRVIMPAESMGYVPPT